MERTQTNLVFIPLTSRSPKCSLSFNFPKNILYAFLNYRDSYMSSRPIPIFVIFVSFRKKYNYEPPHYDVLSTSL